MSSINLEFATRGPSSLKQFHTKRINRKGTLSFSLHSQMVVLNSYCWFSHDVTKIQTKKLSILPRFYFHDALEQLKTNFQTNFCFKRALGFAIEYT